MELESGYLESLKDMLADLSAYDTSRYMPELVDKDHKYLVFERVSSAIVINPEILADKGLPTPKSYQDLLDPQYKGPVSYTHLPRSPSWCMSWKRTMFLPKRPTII